MLRADAGLPGGQRVRAEHSELGPRWLYAEQPVPVLVTENETNNERVFGSPNDTPYVKDGIDRAVVHGETRRRQPGRHRHQGRAAPRPRPCRPAAAPPSGCG